jgi:hypothetical protein
MCVDRGRPAGKVGVDMTTLQASAQKQLRQMIESIERLE